ncbi:bifunctional tRNA (5-methylaminomethyl-2-thiouridine)(34)-methyltransferase MnmD/FAD-dependent 5-carboxymethylaminomethyl-2-thiouridine(34) oxidoreductase MnmC [Alteromonas pelagimontana]|uniref:tRNA 5-methylaminomethyl-2-thiouridine biosynthesis bifunctional protein MnmC n=1 Tax=Alteromonas pelagimontana TaxID=1858656 RepID=A0A6M4MHZ7_9ALTE|nr:bifunctional tRNA (5-methylaminomethyl-2-thiouridine)(34)-methyltransferase MnmD/FAD-dependent 5-carboxymethylaminomethyl-2-thiouridine(34) oxidoreductase MnmC [Alteromonas pelagimontana]QJR82225.1 bifunctional tRNA (5-methylaminomethyl-2-thiouridine)(34)-methyltransferase MnmD/FAD-dependent 5-carboxymethylaminomethyl-2-thiouridine(34) oxidoreductase MnmC [Alteromonas pelagimontana]
MKSTSATVHFNTQGTPVADNFDDVYFSNDSGIDETMHVFMGGNDLPGRWLEHQKSHFVIGETGFGTGLNCLVAMHAFRQFRHANPDHPLTHLFILTTEKYPLLQDDIKKALLAFPTLAEAADLLVAQYPMALQGCHRLHFNAFSTTLDLWQGDVHALLPQWHTPVDGLVDAWFLDGFAPSKNPQMWTDALFSQLGRLSKPGATFGTFTAAGVVKRGLSAAGFEVKKHPGFGRKRDMLVGRYAELRRKKIDAPYYRFSSVALTAHHRVAIVGGGLAGACTAYALAKRGISATLFCHSDSLAQGASGNPQGGFYPQLHAQASFPSQIQALSFLYANRHYRQLAQHRPFSHDWCGVLQLGFSEEVVKRQHKMVSADIWPSEMIAPVNEQEVTAIAGVHLPYSGIYIPQGGWICPPELVTSLINAAAEYVDVKLSHQITEIRESTDVVNLTINNTRYDFDHVILATGADSITLDIFDQLPLRPVRGQVEAIPTQPPIVNLKAVICHKGYLTPAYQGRHALGSTYQKNDVDCTPRESETHINLQTHRKALASSQWIDKLKYDGTARASVRLGMPDHQPAVGLLGDTEKQARDYADLFKGQPLSAMPLPAKGRVSVFTGLGSRGLTTAPLMAEMLVSQLCHQPLPMANSLLQALNPNRFVIRACQRGAAETDTIGGKED